MRQAWWAVAVLVTLALVPASAYSSVPWFADDYTYGGSECTGPQRDPVNLVFQGTNAWASDVARNLEVHAGMTNTEGSTQSLYVNGQPGLLICHAMDRQRATGPNARTHARLWRVPGSGTGAGKLVAAGAHYEQRELACSNDHAVVSGDNTGVSGFDIGRRFVVGRFQDAGHVATGKWWGNTRNFIQCTGFGARSDGIGVVIENNHRH